MKAMLYKDGYTWRKCTERDEFSCEFNLSILRKQGSLTSEEVYKEDATACGQKAMYEVSNKIGDYWVCRVHLRDIFPTVWDRVRKKRNRGDTHAGKL